MAERWRAEHHTMRLLELCSAAPMPACCPCQSTMECSHSPLVLQLVGSLVLQLSRPNNAQPGTLAQIGFNQPVSAQSFGWAVEHDAFRARAATIPAVFEAAAADMGQRRVTADVARAVWDKLLPGLLQVRRPLAAMLCAEGRLWPPVWVISLPLEAQHALSVPTMHVPRGMCDLLRHCSCDLPLVPVIGISTGMLGYDRFPSQDQASPPHGATKA